MGHIVAKIVAENYHSGLRGLLQGQTQQIVLFGYYRGII